MTTRILPRDEWHKLLAVWPLVEQVRSDSMTVIVVEDGETIIGCWGLITLAHAEGIWIDPQHRKGSVARRLWRAFRDLASSRNIGAVITGAEEDSVASMVTRMGGQALPPQFLLPLTKAL